MNWGEAILLGAILAPTDPVLASEVQLTNINDQDELRFGLTSEGGLNDALAFPFVYFGIYALKDDNWGNWFKQWIMVDLIWAIASAILMGIVVAKSIVWIDDKTQNSREHPKCVNLFFCSDGSLARFLDIREQDAPTTNFILAKLGCSQIVYLLMS